MDKRIIEIRCNRCGEQYKFFQRLKRYASEYQMEIHLGWMKTARKHWKDIDFRNRTFTCSRCQLD